VNGRRPPRLKGAAWIVMGLIAVAAIAVGWGSDPTTGSSDDRMFRLSEELRCLQCTGESVANSQAPIAIQMRDEIRRQMRRGRTNDEILTFFADRYGSRVLLNPSGSGLTSVIWVLPVVVGAVALVGVGTTFARARRREAVAGASPEDTELVEAALSDAAMSDAAMSDPDTDGGR
jgi:cytochrome c-type biogenesis protein CcmH